MIMISEKSRIGIIGHGGGIGRELTTKQLIKNSTIRDKLYKHKLRINELVI